MERDEGLFTSKRNTAGFLGAICCSPPACNRIDQIVAKMNTEVEKNDVNCEPEVYGRRVKLPGVGVKPTVIFSSHGRSVEQHSGG